MAISHELSTEIATALLAARERSPRELDDLKKMLLEIHSAFEGLIEKPHEKGATNQPDPPLLSKAIGSST